MAVDIKHLQQWIGKRESRSDEVTPVPIAALSATLDRQACEPKLGDPVPPLWHWLYFLPTARQSDLGSDGHPQRGGFLPPISLPRRMWAGGRVQFHQLIRVRDRISRTSEISDVTGKEGRSGSLVFVTVRHEISNAQGLVITEEQDLVYREEQRAGEAPASPKAAPLDSSWKREIRADEVMLFRYSALTFNGHRIHYDRKFAVETEGYPGLVVHGPLVATLLLELLRENLPNETVSSFAFRAVRPLFDIAAFSTCGRIKSGEKTVELWAQDLNGFLAMEAMATLA